MAGPRGMAAIAIVSALLGAGVTLLVTSARESPRESAAETSPEVEKDAPPPPRQERSAPTRRNGARAAENEPAESADPLAGLSATDEERAFVREALVKERERREDAIVKERERRENAVIRDEDGGLTIFGRWMDSGADVEPLVKDYASMRARVRTGEGRTFRFDPAGEVTPVKLEAVADDAAVIEFGPGRFELETGGRQWDAIGKVVRSLEIRGAGMDRTTLVFRGWAFVFVDKELRNLSVHDLTVDFADRSGTFDIRGRAALALENVRLTGWQVAGHAAPLGISGGAFIACRRCEFLGKGGGFVLSRRGPAIATFDECRFTEVDATFIGGGASAGGRRSVVRVRDSTFENARLTRGAESEIDLRVHGGRVAAGPVKWNDEERRNWWGANHAQSVDGVAFGPGPARFTVGDLLLALDLAERAGITNVVGVEVGLGTRSSGVEIDYYGFDRGTVKLDRTTRRLVNGALADVAEEPRRGKRGIEVKSVADLEGLLPMAELVRRSGIPTDEAITSAELGREMRPGDKTGRMLQLWAAGGRPFVVDARTGELMNR